MLFSDWDRSGRRDLRVSNDRQYYSDLSDGQEQLWRIAPGEPPRLYTADDGWATERIQGMGIGSYDVNGDGYPDVYLTSQGPNVLQSLLDGPSKPTYRDLSVERGVTATRPSTGGDPLPSTAWHPEFEDVNNDGFVDLFVSKGNVGDQADYATRDPSDLFLGQPDGSFVQAAEAAGIVDFARGRGAALADLNLRRPARPRRGVLRRPRSSCGGTWVRMEPRQAPVRSPTGSTIRPGQPARTVDAIGAWVEVRVGDTIAPARGHDRRRPHRAASSAGSTSGSARPTRRDVRVTWPDGTVGPWQHVIADQFVIVGSSVGPGPAVDARQMSARARSPGGPPRSGRACPTSGCRTTSRRSRRRHTSTGWPRSARGRSAVATTGWWSTPIASTARTSPG